jgi:hypothetical protein
MQQQVQQPGYGFQMMPVNYQMPGYLTVNEDPTQNGLGKRMGLYALRSMGKALFHGLSHFFDSTQFGSPAAPPVVVAPPPENKGDK